MARGGRGGRGNQSFLSNRNRAPREADPGEAGEERWLRLDLRLLADVGLLGAQPDEAGVEPLAEGAAQTRKVSAAMRCLRASPVIITTSAKR